MASSKTRWLASDQANGSVTGYEPVGAWVSLWPFSSEACGTGDSLDQSTLRTLVSTHKLDGVFRGRRAGVKDTCGMVADGHPTRKCRSSGDRRERTLLGHQEPVIY